MSEELELQHYGIKGQKWGIRRFQNEDGSLTEEGKKRYADYEKQLNELSREYTHDTAARNRTRITDPRLSVLVDDEFNKNIQRTYDKGQKVISRMKKEGLLSGNAKFEDYVKKYETDLVSNNLSTYTKYVKQVYGRDLTEADIEEMYFMYSSPGEEAQKADNRKRKVAAGIAAGAVIAALGAAIIAGVLHRKRKAGSSGPSGSSKPKKKIKAEVVSTGESKVKEILLPTVVGNKLSKPVNVKFKGEPSLFGGKRGGVSGSYSYSGPLGKGYNIHTGRMRKMKHSCIELDAFLHSDDDEELQHHGIKGQKWGIRRYQNPDGSLTEEGKKRYNADSYDKMDSANKVKYDEDRRDYNLNNISGTSDILRSVGNATSAAQQIPITSGKTIRKSYPNLTDKELQERINRLSLEQRYSDLKGDTKYERSGGEKVREILQTVGASVAIAGSVAAIAATVYGMRHQIPGSKKGKKKN